MKTKEEHLYDAFNDGTGEPQTLEDFVSELKANPYHKPLIEAMQLYSDQQNKELREERPFRFSPTNSEREWQVKIVNDYIHPNQEDWQKMNAVCNSLIEIQRLTKENDDLRDNASEYIKELTRLRELLVRSIDFIDRSKTLGVWDEAKQLLTDIANALNHKP